MTTQSKALRLADLLHNDPRSKVHHDEAAVELRRLVAQRDALLEALKYLTEYAQQHGVMPVALTTARAAIKQAEENT